MWLGVSDQLLQGVGHLHLSFVGQVEETNGEAGRYQEHHVKPPVPINQSNLNY